VSQLLQDAFEADEDDLEHRLTGRSVPSKQITMKLDQNCSHPSPTPFQQNFEGVYKESPCLSVCPSIFRANATTPQQIN